MMDIYHTYKLHSGQVKEKIIFPMTNFMTFWADVTQNLYALATFLGNLDFHLLSWLPAPLRKEYFAAISFIRDFVTCKPKLLFTLLVPRMAEPAVQSTK